MNTYVQTYTRNHWYMCVIYGYTPMRFITRNWQCDFGGWLSKFKIGKARQSKWEDHSTGLLELTGWGQSCCSQVVRKEPHKQDGTPWSRAKLAVHRRNFFCLLGKPQPCFQGLSAGSSKPTTIIQDNVSSLNWTD